MTTPFVPRPALAFRVGVVGARMLTPAAVAGLRPRVRELLATIKARIAACGDDPRSRAAYAMSATGPIMHLISPLAEGADRLVAEEALAAGYVLFAPLPFPRQEYEADFPETADAFRTLLHRAGDRVLELDGARGRHEGRSYEAVGRLMVRNCDLVIAIWDGGPGEGPGGTATIVRYACRFGPPVVWLQADGSRGPAWITEVRSVNHLGMAPYGADADAALACYLTSSIVPPDPPPPHPHGLIDRVADALPRPAPFAAFLAETKPRAHWIWTAPARLIRLAAKHPHQNQQRGGEAPAQDDNPVLAYWQRFYAPADRLAVAYGDWYRSSYVLVFVLAALALLFAVLGVAVPSPAMTAVEFGMLAGILVIVAVNRRRQWHERLIAYRLLAELCRKQRALALLGWNLRAAEATRASGGDRDTHDELSRDGWVGWFFNAARRAAPLPTGAFDPPRLIAARQALVETLVAGQAGYHDERARAHRSAATFFGHVSEGLFLVTLLFVMLEILRLLPHGLVPLIGVLAVVLPGVSAALFGIRSYGELDMMGEQSARMSEVMTRARRRLSEQPMHTPLSSQELGAEAFDLIDEMLRDVEGWTQLFRLKALEAS